MVDSTTGELGFIHSDLQDPVEIGPDLQPCILGQNCRLLGDILFSLVEGRHRSVELAAEDLGHQAEKQLVGLDLCK